MKGEVVQQERAPHRKLLHLTSAGRQRFRIWLSTPTPGSIRAIRVLFLTRLIFALKEDEGFAMDLITNQRKTTERSPKRIEDSLDQIPSSQVINQLSQQLRIRQLRSCVEWLDECQLAIPSHTPIRGELAS